MKDSEENPENDAAARGDNRANAGPQRLSKAKAKQHQVSVPWAARTLTGAKRAAVINRG